ncbi:hypothetical protein GpartN1_g3779.t1 [Galdieria partita]|uniref:Uncharacterized protein n=1 Tax=Galdieria partita TaxID=83374 RepID=A0A9C7PWD2_9RHOD|nr:hypothetical protein GpartN1_g3779.t1 [Galdieria partita]
MAGGKHPCGFVSESRRPTAARVENNHTRIYKIAIPPWNIWSMNSKTTAWKPQGSSSDSFVVLEQKQDDVPRDQDNVTETENVIVQETGLEDKADSSTKSDEIRSVDLVLKTCVKSAVENSFRDFSKVYELYLQRFEAELESLHQRIIEQKKRREKLEKQIITCMNTPSRIEELLTTVVNSRNKRHDKENNKHMTASLSSEYGSRTVFEWDKRVERIERNLTNFHNSSENRERKKIAVSFVASYEERLSKLAKKTETLYQDAVGAVERQDAVNKELEQSLEKLDNLAHSTESMKHFVERNICIRSDAESLVKEQVSMITKQVCIEMRRITTKNLRENNLRISNMLQRNIEGFEDDLATEFNDDG